MRKSFICAVVSIATMAVSSKGMEITSIDPAQLATMNRTDPAFAELRTAWANYLHDEARDQRLTRLQEQLKVLQQRAAEIDAIHSKGNQQVVDGEIVFTSEEIAARQASALRDIAAAQKEIVRLGKLKEWYRTGDSTAAGLGVDELEGTPPPDQVNQMILDLTLKVNDLQRRLANPAEPDAEEKAQMIHARQQELLRLEQTRKPVAEGIVLLQKQIEAASAQAARTAKSDREWLTAHREAIAPLMR